MIHPKTSLKYKVEITANGFDQEADSWNVVIRDQFQRVFSSIEKDDCIRDTEGNWYFLLDSVLTGKYFAYTTVYVPDDDYEDGKMVITDKQHLVDVGLCSCGGHRSCCCKTDGLQVVFTRVFSTNIDDAAYLCDMDGNLILTAEGKRIKFITPTPNTEENEESND